MRLNRVLVLKKKMKFSFDLSRYPAGLIYMNSNGRSSDLSHLLRLPSVNQWQRVQ